LPKETKKKADTVYLITIKDGELGGGRFYQSYPWSDDSKLTWTGETLNGFSVPVNVELIDGYWLGNSLGRPLVTYGTSHRSMFMDEAIAKGIAKIVG
jgi:hypothetical protein